MKGAARIVEFVHQAGAPTENRKARFLHDLARRLSGSEACGSTPAPGAHHKCVRPFQALTSNSLYPER